jgi:hypothetical protein
MSHHEDEPAPARPRGLRSRRAYLAFGVAGLTVAVAGGTYLLTGHAPGRNETSPAPARRVQSAVPVSPSGSQAGASPSPSPSPSESPSRPRTPEERVAAARKAMKEHGVPVLHPLPPPSEADMALAASAKVSDSGSLTKDGAIMRVVTARGDLTGLRELAWVAGGITVHGKVSCSQTFRFANEAGPERKPTLMVCWRTSAKKSVITAAVSREGHPSASWSATVIAREWRKLG